MADKFLHPARLDLAMACLYDAGADGDLSLVPGQSLGEWLRLIVHDWDDVDRMYVDRETIGG